MKKRVESDDIGFTIVAIAGSCVDRTDEWHDQFMHWYKPKEWLGSHRAAAVFVGMKYKTRGRFPKKLTR